MKKLFCSLTGFLACTTAAIGADLPAKAPAYQPPPLYNWSGCYIGGDIGGGAAWHDNTVTRNQVVFNDFSQGEGFSNHSSGFVGGGHVGCNYQTGRLVLGIEGAYLASAIKGTFNSPFGGADDIFTHKITGIASVVGRLGFAVDNLMIYSKGGWAAARASMSVVDNIPPTGAGSDERWHSGFTVGGGAEYAIFQNWIIGAEANYYRFGTESYELGGGTGFYTFDSRPRDVITAVARASYKW